MKSILLICECPSAGVGKYVLDLLPHLLEHAERVVLVWSRARASANFEEAIIQEKMRFPNFSVLEVLLKRAPAVSDLFVLSRLKKMIETESQFEWVIYGVSFKGGLIGRLLSILTAIPAIYAPHGYFFRNEDGFASWLNSVVERGLAPAAVTICTSIDEVSAYDSLNSRGEHRYIPNGVAAALDEVALSQLQQGEGRLVLGFVGRFEQQKDPERFLKVALELWLSNSAYEFLMFGEGTLSEEIDQIISNLVSSYPGFSIRRIHHAPLDKIFGEIDLLLCTSRYEGFPYIFLESISRGVPVLSTDVGGRVEVVTDLTGCLLDRDLTNVKKYCRQMLIDVMYRREQSKEALRLSQKYTIERMVCKTLAVIDEV